MRTFAQCKWYTAELSNLPQVTNQHMHIVLIFKKTICLAYIFQPLLHVGYCANTPIYPLMRTIPGSNSVGNRLLNSLDTEHQNFLL